jgi:hypothetical protein
VRGLYPTEARTLSIVGSNKQATMRYSFVNNLSVPVTINRVFMKYGTYFSVASTNPTPTPFVLNAGEEMNVTITYNAPDLLLYTDSLLIDASHNFQNITYSIQGKQESQGGVRNELPPNVSIAISPNPASRIMNISIAGIRSAAITIFDMLGKEVASAVTNNKWQWDVSKMENDSYIVRIAAESETGERFITSKRVVVNK